MNIELVPVAVALAGMVTGGVFLSRALAGSKVEAGTGNADARPGETVGELRAVDRDGRPGAACPLKHTAVRAAISGPLTRVRVTQQFENPFSEAIEAVYIFPLPDRAAVDDMTLHIGDRVVRGLVKEREEARRIFEHARRRGRLAGLLDQERPNIFTQAVTNIPPGVKVEVEISYVETVKYEAGAYEFVFPMVVGPRYIPAGLPHPLSIAPPVTPKGARAGHDISLELAIEPGLPVESLSSPTHPIDVDRTSALRAQVRLRNAREIPNRDFILRYSVAGPAMRDAILTHRDSRGGFFTLLLQPPDHAAPPDMTPKEVVFVMDTSGSMEGFPIEKSKEVIKLALDGLNPGDTFNLITFAGDTRILFPEPVPATRANVQEAQRFLLGRSGAGGTEMMKAVRAALQPSASRDHLRIVCFLTDGYVGNDMEIVAEVRRYPTARVFSFGIGSAVNRFLLDRMAQEGRGEVEYVGLNDDGSAAARRFWDRVRAPLLTDIELDFQGLPVADVYPSRQPDLFAARPVVVAGRFTAPARGVIRLHGKTRGGHYWREIPVDFSQAGADHDVLATLWARQRIEHLTSQDWNSVQHRNPRPELKAEIIRLGIEFRLMTQFTSFVAVEEQVVTDGGTPRRIEVPVEMPQGVSYEGVFGAEVSAMPLATAATPADFSAAMPSLVPMRPQRAAPAPPLPRETKSEAAGKLDPALAEIVAKLRQGVPAAALPPSQFVSQGKVSVKVWLKDEPAKAVAALRRAGLDIRSERAGQFILGVIAAERLEALAALEVVLFVSADLGQP